MLMHICSLTLNIAIFPVQLKIAKITPIFKKGEKYILENNTTSHIESS